MMVGIHIYGYWASKPFTLYSINTAGLEQFYTLVKKYTDWECIGTSNAFCSNSYPIKSTSDGK